MKAGNVQKRLASATPLPRIRGALNGRVRLIILCCPWPSAPAVRRAPQPKRRPSLRHHGRDGPPRAWPMSGHL